MVPIGVMFLLSGIIVNLILATCFVTIRPFSKTMYRKINILLAELLWIQLIWLVDWWAGLKKDAWSDEEDRVLIRAHSELGTKWSEIAKLLPGRTENSIKNRWYANKRKFPRSTNNGRRGRYPKSGSSLLQNYMQSLARCSPAPAIPKKKKTNHNRPSAAVENVHMPEMYDVVQQFQQLSFDSGASSSNSNSGIDVGLDWSGAMPSLVMFENEKWEMDLPEMAVLDNSFIF